MHVRGPSLPTPAICGSSVTSKYLNVHTPECASPQLCEAFVSRKSVRISVLVNLQQDWEDI